MREAEYYLMEAQFCIDSFVDVSLAEAFFEDTDEAKEKITTNEKAKTGALGALKKLFDRLVQLVKDCIDKLTTFFQTRYMDADEKKRYLEFKQMVKNDPELKNKKVTVIDFREYEKAYDAALKAIEEEAKKENPTEEAMKKIMDELTDTIKHIAERAALSVTMDTAIEIADKNTMCAKGINLALQHENVLLNEIRKELGDARAYKFEKKIDKLSKKGLLHMWRIRLFHRKEATLEAILKKEKNRILSYTNIDKDRHKLKKGKSPVSAGSILKGAAQHPTLFSDAVGGPKNVPKATASLVKAQAVSSQAKLATNTASTLAKGVIKHGAPIAAKGAEKYVKTQADDLTHFLGIDKLKDKNKNK